MRGCNSSKWAYIGEMECEENILNLVGKGRCWYTPMLAREGNLILRMKQVLMEYIRIMEVTLKSYYRYETRNKR